MTNTQKQSIVEHGKNLLAIYPNATEQDPVKLCKKLRRLETKAHASAESYCNGEIDGDQWSKVATDVKIKVFHILGFAKGYDYHVHFVNGDPRGYALKISDEAMRDNQWKLERDWGGYGLIAPEIW